MPVVNGVLVKNSKESFPDQFKKIIKCYKRVGYMGLVERKPVFGVSIIM